MIRFDLARLPSRWAAIAAVAMLVSMPAAAHEAGAQPSLSDAPVPLYARFRVKVLLPVKPARPAVHQVWHFHRDAAQVALLKGAIDEVWHRDPRGLVSFERIFHDDRRAVDYSAGELATLGISTDWASLSSVVDPQVLKGLRLVSRRGTGFAERLVFAGSLAGEQYRIEWLSSMQLPERMLRTERGGRRTELVLERHVAAAPAGWPVPGTRSGDYLRLDAADFGDMEYEAVVRRSEALDIRLGWRVAHQHD